jgi:hypothetical protein
MVVQGGVPEAWVETPPFTHQQARCARSSATASSPGRLLRTSSRTACRSQPLHQRLSLRGLGCYRRESICDTLSRLRPAMRTGPKAAEGRLIRRWWICERRRTAARGCETSDGAQSQPPRAEAGPIRSHGLRSQPRFAIGETFNCESGGEEFGRHQWCYACFRPHL